MPTSAAQTPAAPSLPAWAALKLHSVRHTLALIMHRAGVAPVDAAAFLGHTLAVHVSTYAPSTEQGARTAASGLGVARAGVR